MLKSLLSILLFLICSAGWAADNANLISYPDGKIMGFRGLDTTSTAPTAADGRASDLLNVKLSTAFDLKKRDGYSVINGTLDDIQFSSPAITGIFDSEYSTGESWTLVFVGNKLKYDNVGVWGTVTGTATITSGQDNQWGCIMALDNAVCTNNVDIPIKVNNTPIKSNFSFTGLASPITKAKAVIWYRNYLIWGNTVEGGVTNPTRFRWSDVGTIDTYTNVNRVNIASNNGDEIIEFKELYGDLYIFMRKSIWKASLVGGNDVFVFTKVVDNIGAISRGSVQQVTLPNNRLGVIFLTDDKRIFLFEGITVTDIGVLIQNNLDDLNAARLQYATAIFDGDDYFLSVSDGGSSINDIVFDYQVQIEEWTKHDNIDANAFARIKETTSVIKTYFGNYSCFVYWLDNPDNINDVDGAFGIVDSVATISTSTETGAQILIDTGITSGIYTGAIVRITSGTGEGEERVVLASTSTGVIVTTAFSTIPDSTSNYSIGDIDANYTTKWYDFANAEMKKAYRKLYFWAKEETNHEVNFSYAEDYGAIVGAETKSLSPSAGSLWDSAIWDTAVWGTTGNKFYTTRMTGQGRVVNITFSQSAIDKTFNIYGFHFLADRLDRD